MATANGPWPISEITIERGAAGWHEAFVADCIRRAFPVPVRVPLQAGDAALEADGRPLVADRIYTTCRVAFQRAAPAASSAIPPGTQLAILSLEGEDRVMGMAGASRPTLKYYEIDIRTQGQDSTAEVLEATESIIRCLAPYTQEVVAVFDPEDTQRAAQVNYTSRIIELALTAYP